MKNETIKSDGYTISYTYHKGKKPITIIPIHGLGGSKEYWQPIHNYPKLLDYGILIPDLIGYGDSIPVPREFKYSMHEQAQAIKSLIDTLRIRGDYVLIPHSMGGPIGIYLAELLSPHVEGIIYAEGNIDFNDCFSSNKVITMHTLKEYVDKGFEEELKESEKNGQYPQLINSQMKAGPVTVYRSSEDLVRVSKSDTLAKKLEALKVPILVIYGEKNKGLWTSEKKLSSLFPLVYISGAGHIMMLDNPNAFYSEVEKFVNSLT